MFSLLKKKIRKNSTKGNLGSQSDFIESRYRTLNARVNASAFDSHYQMALVYCFDEEQNYRFSLNRFPNEDQIEVMVLDQINCKVDDLSVVLTSDEILVEVEAGVSQKLDGTTHYRIQINGGPTSELRDALAKIFEKKQGFCDKS